MKESPRFLAGAMAVLLWMVGSGGRTPAQPGERDEIGELSARMVSDPSSAIPRVEAYLARCIAAGDPLAVLRARVLLIEGFARLGQVNEGLALLPEVEPEVRRLPPHLARLAYGWLARLCRTAGFPTEAYAFFRRALDIAAAAGQEEPTRTLELEAVDALLAGGFVAEATRELHTLSQERNNCIEVGLRTAALDLSRGRASAARDRLKALLSAGGEGLGAAQRAEAATWLARSCRRLGRDEEAAGHLDDTLASEIVKRSASARSRTHEACAEHYRATGQPERAIAHLRQARLEISGSPLLHAREPGLILTLGWLLLAKGDREGAEQRFREGMALLRSGRRQDLLWLGLFGLARILESTGDEERALDLCHRALSALKRSGTAGANVLEPAPLDRKEVFVHTVRLLARIRPQPASEERTRGAARIFAAGHERDREAGGVPTPRPVPMLLAHSLELRRLDPGLAAPEREALLRQRLALEVPPERLPADALATVREALQGDGDVALLYLAGRDATFGLAVTRTRAGLVALEGRTEEWAGRVARFRLLLREPGFGRDVVPGGRALYRGLVAPLLAAVERTEAERLLVVPDGPVADLPMCALVPPEHPGRTWLGFVTRISYLPDAKGVAETAQLTASGRATRVVAVTGADTDRAARHAARVASYGGPTSRTLVGKEATSARLEAAIRAVKPGVLHLDVPVRTRCALDADHGAARPSETGSWIDVEGLRDPELGGALVVAADPAPDSRSGPGRAGCALLRAGAGSVLTTRWPIERRIAARFTERFYHHLADGLDLGTALLETRRDFSRSPGFGGPSTWAAFQMVGGDARTLSLRKPFRMFSLWWTVALVATLVAGFRIVRILARASTSPT